MESVCMDTSDSDKCELPAWRMPISTTFSPSLRDRTSPTKTTETQVCPVDLLLSDDNNHNFMANENRPAVSQPQDTEELIRKEDESQIIQILLPCIVCNRTFSPEALERHAKVCTKVNVKSPYKPERGTFDISEKRKKGTRLEDFIPPPTFDALTDNRFGFSRGSRNRASLRGTSCTTRSTLNTPATQSRSRERSVSQSRESRAPSSTRATGPPSEYPYDDNSEFGSNNSAEENNSPDVIPRYAKPIAPTDVCPYCNRTFGVKSFDRHVEFCKEVYERKRYEIQPTPKEKEEAMERQEIRTKYRPMKSSSSCSSLRSMSPAKDFANMAMKLFGGLRRTEGTSNLYFNQIKNNLKQSNESIANSCYGDYTRGMRRTSPSPARTPAATAANKLNNLLSKSYHHQQQQQQQQHQQHLHQYGLLPAPGSMLPMRVNTSSNIPKLAKSSESLISGNGYAHVMSSGYGQAPAAMMMNMNSNNFSRNSRSRSSLHKNFFRTKRAEPDGTENTSMSQSPTSTSPLIITPVNFYSKGTKLPGGGDSGKLKEQQQLLHETLRPTGTSLLTSDPDYDPYEKAAKQLEELLKTTPIKSSKRTSRRTGLEKAFESVGVPSDMPSLGKSRLGRTQSLDCTNDPFGLSSPGTRGTTGGLRRGTDPYGLGMSMTPNIDDSYWDQILRKGNNNNNTLNGNHNRMPTTTPAEPVSCHEESDTSGASDTAKSRAMSNTSSADSAFSRSEVTDPEFEALESIVSLSDMGSSTGDSGYKMKTSSSEDQRNKSRDLFSTNKSLDLHRITTRVPRSASVDQGRIPMDIAPTPERQKGLDVGGAWAKFCHECGSPYPTCVAKFCSDCGEKRVYKT